MICRFVPVPLASQVGCLALALACVGLTACQTNHHVSRSADSVIAGGRPPRQLGGTHEEKRLDLTRQIVALAPGVDPGDARLVADASIRESEALAKRYRVVRPALLHNVFVHAGWRHRGLCFHWADDLHAKLTALPVETLAFHRSVAFRGRLREHNAVVVTAKAQPLEDGLVLDGWKYGGRLGVIRVQNARLPWKPF